MSGLEKIADISMKSNENTEVKYEKNKWIKNDFW
jgi:hypothetical protein